MLSSRPPKQPAINFTWYLRPLLSDTVYILATQFLLDQSAPSEEEEENHQTLTQTFIPKEHELFVEKGPFAGRYTRFKHVATEIRKKLDKGDRFVGEDTKVEVVFGRTEGIQAAMMDACTGLGGRGNGAAGNGRSDPPQCLATSNKAATSQQPSAYYDSQGYITPPLLVPQPLLPSDLVPSSRDGKTYTQEEVTAIVRSATHDLQDHIHTLHKQITEREDMLIEMDDLLSRKEREQVYVYVIMVPELGPEPIYRMKKALVSEEQIRTWVVRQTGLEEFHDGGRHMVLVVADEDMPYQHWVAQQRKGKTVLRDDTDVVECIIEMVFVGRASTTNSAHQQEEQQDLDITPTNKPKPLPDVSHDMSPQSIGDSPLGLRIDNPSTSDNARADYHPRAAQEILKILRDERVSALSTATRRLVALAQSLTPTTRSDSDDTPLHNASAIKPLPRQVYSPIPQRGHSAGFTPLPGGATTPTGSGGETSTIRGSITSIEAVINGGTSQGKVGSTRTPFDMLVWRRDVGEATGDEEKEADEVAEGGDGSDGDGANRRDKEKRDFLDVPRTRGEAKRKNPFLGHRHQRSAPPATTRAPSIIVTNAPPSPSEPLAALCLDDDIPSPDGSPLIGATHIEDLSQPEKTEGSTVVPLFVLRSPHGRSLQPKSIANHSTRELNRTQTPSLVSHVLGPQQPNTHNACAELKAVEAEGSPRKKVRLLLGERLDSVDYVSGAL
ncbi:hypothetical protein IAR50_002756 [Cryptococcus sp. DSM 104548]